MTKLPGDSAKIIAAVESGGYTAEVDDGKQQAAPAQGEQVDEALHEMKKRIIVSAVFMVVLMYFSMGEMVGLPLPSYAAGMDGMFALALTELVLTLPIVIINRKYYINGFKTLLHRAPTMDALIAVGSGAALVYGIYALVRIGTAPTPEVAHSFMHDLYFESAGMILTLVTLGKFFEARAQAQDRRGNRGAHGPASQDGNRYPGRPDHRGADRAGQGGRPCRGARRPVRSCGRRDYRGQRVPRRECHHGREYAGRAPCRRHGHWRDGFQERLLCHAGLARR